MRNFYPFIALILIHFQMTSGPAWSQSKNIARIKIDIERQVGTIDKNLYGNFTEHLGRCVYRGLYDPASKEADQYGFRKDVEAGIRALNVPVLRWPGGNFASGYHWQDGIGPADQRPVRIDLAWGAHETNRFGTDEFLSFCRRMNVEPYLCVNLGTGSLDEARDWVEYCNTEKGTYFSDLRRKNGAEQPYKVKYWGLGNEMDGPWQMGHKNAEDYGKYALEAAKLMKWVDPEIKLVACGSSNYGGDWILWNRTVLDYLVKYIDYISLHQYVGNRENDYYQFMTSSLDLERNIKIVKNEITEARIKAHRDTPVYIAFDEYNVWYRVYIEQGLEEVYDLEDALVIAQFLNAFVRNADIVKMANMAQLVNVIAPMLIKNDTLFYQSIFYPLQLFANNCFGQSLDVFVDCGKFSTKDHPDVPYLDVSSAYDKANRQLVVNVVNRNKDDALTTEILSQFGKFSGTATVYTVNGKDIKDSNSTREQKVKSVATQVSVSGDRFTYNFPAHSFTMIKVRVEE